MTTIALAVPHCPWDPHRVKSLQRVRQACGLRNDVDDHPHLAAFRLFAEVGPTPPHVWSGKLFQWAAEQGADWVVQVQDDVVPCPDFVDVAKAALSEAGKAGADVVGFFTIAPPAANFAAMGCNWLTTTDWMTGPAWAIRPSFAREFVQFKNLRMRDGWADRVKENSLNEDTLLGLGCAALGRRIWNPLPALVDHDVTVPSHYTRMAADHPYNRSSYSWERWAKDRHDVADLKDPAFWVPRNPVQGSLDKAVHLGVAYTFTLWNFMRWVKDDGLLFGGIPWDKRADLLKVDTVKLEAFR
jgi:hypothetical protein